MKLIKIAAVVSALFICPYFVKAQVLPAGGPGIAIAGSANDSSLPARAHEFISKYYPGGGMVSVEKNFVRDRYDVSLSNGVEIEFNGKGNVRSIEAPDNRVLADSVVKALLPEKAYRHLHDNGLAYCVEEISIGRCGYEVELSIDGADLAVYNISGEFVEFDD